MYRRERKEARENEAKIFHFHPLVRRSLLLGLERYVLAQILQMRARDRIERSAPKCGGDTLT